MKAFIKFLIALVAFAVPSLSYAQWSHEANTSLYIYEDKDGNSISFDANTGEVEMTSIESIFKFDEEGFVDCIVYFYKNGKLIKKSEIPFTIDDLPVIAIAYDITNGLLTHLKNGGNLLITAPRKNKSELKLNIPKLTSSSSNGKPSAQPKTTSKPAAKAAAKPTVPSKSSGVKMGTIAEVGSFRYKTTSATTCTLELAFSGIAGDAVIPQTVNIKGRNITVTSISPDAFGSTGYSSITIPASITSIEPNAFANQRYITSMYIPSSVKRIGLNAFSWCYSLNRIDVDPSNPYFKSIDGILFDKQMATVLRYPENKVGNYTIPSSVTAIDEGAFSFCKSLTGITIPFGVTTIAYFTFWGCNSLSSVSIPNSVTTIGRQAFGCCSSLTVLNLPSSVVTVGEDAISMCSSLKIINCYAKTPPTIEGSQNIAALTIHVPRGCADAYRQAEYWKLHTIVDDL